MNEKEKEKVKKEEEEGIWVREQRKRKRSRRRRREEQLADRLDLAPASDGGQRQRQQAEVRGQTSVIFLFFFHCWRVGAVSKPCRRRRRSELKKKNETLAGHRNQASRTRTGVRHVSDTDTTPKMVCPCNLAFK